MSDVNAIALRHDAYAERLSLAYADSYEKWVSTRPTLVQQRIRTKANNLKQGLATVSPLTCKGPKACPFFHACPIPESVDKPGLDSDYPINLPCVLEVEYCAQQVITYMQTLQVDPNNAVEMSLVQELALLDLVKNRAVLVLSGGDSKGHGRDLLTVDTNEGWDSSGNPTLQTSVRVHPAIDIIDRFERRRTKILDKFAATRESQIKFYGGNLESNSKLMQDLSLVRSFIEHAMTKGLSLDTAGEPIKLNPDEYEVIKL